MKKYLLGLLAFPCLSYAISITDYSPFEYEVLFTNPKCATHYYNSSVMANDGNVLRSKPQNTYCTPADAGPASRESNSPHFRLVEWIRNPSNREIFMTYLSFSNKDIAKELCQAVKRGVLLTLIIDSNNKDEESRMRAFNDVKKCSPQNVKQYLRGGNGTGTDKLGYAHNKLTIFNPQDKRSMRLVFSSGNLSSGTSTHHENWHFLTVSPKSYFAKSHLCLMTGMIEHANGIKDYSNFMKKCRGQIDQPEESDLKAYFIPGDGKEAMRQIYKNFDSSESFYLAAHRFSNGQLISKLDSELKKSKYGRLIVDDDMYWAGRYRKTMGRNTPQESNQVRKLENLGLDVKYMETYVDSVDEAKSMQLQHNKFILFLSNNGGSVFTGAGNLTTAAFTQNFENFYSIDLQKVVDRFDRQHDHMWDDLATDATQLPKNLVIVK